MAGLALILGIDRFMSEARALTNVIGNGVATFTDNGAQTAPLGPMRFYRLVRTH